ncbi:galactokinase [Marivirga lumbricoides]
MKSPQETNKYFLEQHRKYFGVEPRLSVKAPGRINMIGEHTDYNLGFVLPAAINKAIYFSVNRSQLEEVSTVYAIDVQQEIQFKHRDLAPLEAGSWQNYILGVVSEIIKVRGNLPGFCLSFGGDVPLGAGLSSSAALECGLCFALNELFELNLSWQEMAKISQLAEHHFVGTKCGIMDQISSLRGKKDHVMLLDCRSLDIKYFPCALVGYQIVICNSNVTHELASSAYNERRAQCEEGVAVLQSVNPEIKSLRDVSYEFLLQNKESLSEVVFKRCAYITKENDRVIEFCEALQNQNIDQLENLLYNAHSGMQHEYEITCPEIDFLVDYTRNLDQVKGSRMMGGGFGGCTINIVKDEFVDQFKSEISEAYSNRWQKDLSILDLEIGDGVQLYSR